MALFYNPQTGFMTRGNAPRYRVRHWVTWPDGRRCEITNGGREWRWTIDAGTDGLADTLRDAKADIAAHGGTYTQTRE
jgi:hypothetical protein